MATRWTDEQLSAINTRDKTLLVSAAAGSGKTATLTERIIRSLTDPVSPMDIDSVLVVTFTNAAAAELRAKISKALTKAVEENPEDSHLKRQLYLLPAAKIRTIDSFCNEILRANCDRVGVSPGYRIADTAECELLATSIIEGLIQAVYNGELPEVASPSEFEELADCLTDSGRTEELADVLRFIHLRCDSAEEGIHLLDRLRENYNSNGTSVEDTIYGCYLMARYREMVEHYIACYDRYIKDFGFGGEAEAQYIPLACSDRELLLRLKNAANYDSARELILNYQLERKPVVRKGKTERMECFSALRDMMKDDLEDMQNYFLYTTEQWQTLFSSLYRLLGILYRFECEFDRLFSEEKRRRGALSYADIERYTYNCLIKDGDPTDIARSVVAQFEAIYIDEYQDVNSLQNRIFEVISRPNNRFMVGDIKQSIYGFRSACPEIFASMKNAFPSLDVADGDTASIFMSRNFRCDKGVVDFVNNIFDRAFGFVAESIGYVDSDKLKYSKIQECGEPEYRYPTICMTDKGGDEDMTSPEVVAAKISQLLREGRLNDGSPIRPSDIAIILRNASGRDGKYAEALEKVGIPCCISGAKDFFLSPEVLLALCLLNTIDNPRRDIYLAGLLCSPLFDFTADELYLIKRQKKESLYESLVAYVSENPEFAKGVSFLKTLDYYRAIAEGIGVDSLIHKLYRETGLMSLASKSGGKENLTLLYDYARSYEAGSFKGLYNFISFINNIIDKKTTFDDARARTGVDAVKIVTAHASKGLEYPVVFLVEADGRIYNKDKDKRLIISEDFGISFLLRTPSGIAVVKNPVQDIINHRIARKLYEEELRILYVALTRAREQLYVVGRCPTVKRDEYMLKLEAIKENLSEYSFRNLSSYLEIILACEGSQVYSSESFAGVRTETEEGGKVEENEFSFAEQKTDGGICDTLVERFSYEYPSPYLTVLPEKMSVSAMSPTVLDGSELDGITIDKLPPVIERISLDDNESDKPRHLPSFATGGEEDESAKRGIATHLFMQFCNLENLKKNGAKAELDRLKSTGFIGEADAERVRVREIELFRNSKLLSDMLSAKKIYRELRFNVYLPASAFTADEAKRIAYRGRDILVQGVIDCIIESNDGSLILCDYKTDRLTRAELADRTLAEKKLRDKHEMQLGLYSLAVEKIFARSPNRIEIYSLPLGDTVSII